jgi:hypothetical protein
MPIVPVVVTWKGASFNIKLDTAEPVEVFRMQLQALTAVPCAGQKIMGFPGGVLKASSWTDVALKGDKISVVMSGESVPAPAAHSSPSFAIITCKATFNFVKGPCIGRVITHDFDAGATVAQMKQYLQQEHGACDPRTHSLVLVWEQQGIKLRDDALTAAALGGVICITVSIAKKGTADLLASAPLPSVALPSSAICSKQSATQQLPGGFISSSTAGAAATTTAYVLQPSQLPKISEGASMPSSILAKLLKVTVKTAQGAVMCIADLPADCLMGRIKLLLSQPPHSCGQPVSMKLIYKGKLGSCAWFSQRVFCGRKWRYTICLFARV